MPYRPATTLGSRRPATDRPADRTADRSRDRSRAPRLDPQTDGRPPPPVYDPDMRRLPLMIDLGFAALLLAVVVPLVFLAPGGPHSAPGLVAAVGLAVVQAGCLLWIRRYPEAAMAVAIAVGVPLEVL